MIYEEQPAPISLKIGKHSLTGKKSRRLAITPTLLRIGPKSNRRSLHPFVKIISKISMDSIVHSRMTGGNGDNRDELKNFIPSSSRVIRGLFACLASVRHTSGQAWREDYLELQSNFGFCCAEEERSIMTSGRLATIAFAVSSG